MLLGYCTYEIFFLSRVPFQLKSKVLYAYKESTFKLILIHDSIYYCFNQKYLIKTLFIRIKKVSKYFCLSLINVYVLESNPAY